MSLQSARPELLKNLNQELILRCIVKFGEISRTDLSKETGLALPSVMRISDALIQKGFIVDIGQGVSTGGRKPTLLTINKDYKYIVGVEIASHTLITLTDFAGDTIDSKHIDVRNDNTPLESLSEIAKVILTMLEDNSILSNQVAAIGVGTPGKDFKHRQAIKGFMKKGWESIDVEEQLSKLTNISVIVDNVARTRTLSEIWFGVGKNHSSFLYAFIDWGVGIGIVSQSEIVTGAQSVAGEFGHMSIDMNGESCYCGNKGCIEMYASIGAFERKLKCSNFDWVIEHQSEPEVQEVIAEVANSMAFALGNTINLLNPEMVVLGGLVPRKLTAFSQIVSEKIGQYIFHNLAVETPIVCSEVDNEKACLGSIALVINHELMSRDE